MSSLFPATKCFIVAIFPMKTGVDISIEKHVLLETENHRLARHSRRRLNDFRGIVFFFSVTS